MAFIFMMLFLFPNSNHTHTLTNISQVENYHHQIRFLLTAKKNGFQNVSKPNVLGRENQNFLSNGLATLAIKIPGKNFQQSTTSKFFKLTFLITQIPFILTISNLIPNSFILIPIFLYLLQKIIIIQPHHRLTLRQNLSPHQSLMTKILSLKPKMIFL